MEGKNRKTKVLAAVMMLAAMMIAGYTHAQGNSSSGKSADTPPASAGKTYTVGGVSFTMKKIAAVADKTIGHNDEYNNKPHTVNLSAYLIGETEVTQELWTAVMGAGNNPSNFTDSLKNPVEKVSWYQCIAFCNELTKKIPELGESQCVYTVDGHTYGTADATAKKVPAMDMTKKGFRLPTEAEWEWAAMGGTDYKWAGTNTDAELKDYAWYCENGDHKTHQVKMKKPNGYGLYDMSGNVWEWCWDWHHWDTPTSGQTNPLGAASGSYRVIRGGSWKREADNVARAYRGISGAGIRYGNLGFRVVSKN